MSIDNYRRQPIHERLFNPPTSGGVSTKHLYAMLNALCHNTGRANPGISRDDRQLLASYLRGNFTPEQINWAHEDRKAFYRRVTSETPTIPRTPVAPMPRTTPQNNDFPPIPEYFPPIPESRQEDSKPAPTPEPSKEDKPKRQEKPIREPREGENDIYVLRRDYDTDREALVEEFANYDKKFKGQQKAIENTISKVDVAVSKVDQTMMQLDNRMTQLESHAPFHVKVQYVQRDTVVDVGITHKQFPLLVKASNARLESNGSRLNIWLYGPAGTGKTYAAESLARCEFGTDYQSTVWTDSVKAEFKSKFNQEWKGHDYNGSLATQFQVFGYMDATGKYVSTAFRRIWEYGGVYLFDEIDGSMPDALLALQGALSSEYASFPDGLVKRHKDCIIIAGANTTGLGGGIEYVGAMKQNTAFLNRWVYLNWDHDDALEDALCSDKKWVRRVRHIRAGIIREQIRGHLVTMRQSMYGTALLQAGIDWEDVERMVLRGSLSDAQWERVRR